MLSLSFLANRPDNTSAIRRTRSSLRITPAGGDVGGGVGGAAASVGVGGIAIVMGMERYKHCRSRTVLRK